MGQATCDVREFPGLDKILSCLATSDYNDCSGNKLEFRIRIAGTNIEILNYLILG